MATWSRLFLHAPLHNFIKLEEISCHRTVIYAMTDACRIRRRYNEKSRYIHILIFVHIWNVPINFLVAWIKFASDRCKFSGCMFVFKGAKDCGISIVSLVAIRDLKLLKSNFYRLTHTHKNIESKPRYFHIDQLIRSKVLENWTAEKWNRENKMERQIILRFLCRTFDASEYILIILLLFMHGVYRRRRD